RVSKIFFEISAMIQIFAIDFRDREPVAAKMLGKLQKRHVLFTHAIQNANRGPLFAGKPDDLPPRTAKLALQRLNPLHRRAKMLLKEPVENVHEQVFQVILFCITGDTSEGICLLASCYLSKAGPKNNANPFQRTTNQSASPLAA